MNERRLFFSFHQTGDATDGDWVFAFPFPTQLLGVKHSGSNGSKTSTFTIGGGATISATTISNSGDPTYTRPDSQPDYVAADTAYTLNITANTAIDDPCLVFDFLVGEGGTYMDHFGERMIAIPIYQTGTAATAGWVVEFPFPTYYHGWYACGSNSNDSTLTLAGGVVDAAAAIGDSGTPTWAGPTSAPDYCAADTVITVTLTQGSTQADDPMALLFFSVGEGGAYNKALGELIQCTSLFQTGSATTGGWVIEFPIPTQYMGCQGSSSTTSATTHTMAGGAVDAAAEIGASGASTWLTPTTEPDYVAKDTACTATITQSATRADDPMIIHVWQLGEG